MFVNTLEFDDDLLFNFLPERVLNGRFRKQFADFRARMTAKGWKYLGRGRHRYVYQSPRDDRVIKVSCVPWGVKANLYELHFAKLGDSMTVDFYTGRYTVPIPQVFGHTRVGLLSVLCVEHVTPTDKGFLLSRQPRHNWIPAVDVSNGCPQVGYTGNGRLVCFDWCRF